MTTYEFMSVLRGYDADVVDEFLARVTRAVESGSRRASAEAADAVRHVEFPTALRGYDRAQVDAVIARLAHQLGLYVEPLPVVQFDIVLSGYEIGPVDELFSAALAALASTDVRERAEAAAAVRGATFRVKLRGYDRGQVDAMLKQFARELAACPRHLSTGWRTRPPRRRWRCSATARSPTLSSLPVGRLGHRRCWIDGDGSSRSACRSPTSNGDPSTSGRPRTLFGLPTFCQYGVGALGVGAWRELRARWSSAS